MSLNLPICHACNTTLSRKQRTNITENVTNPPYLGAQLKKCDHIHSYTLTSHIPHSSHIYISNKKKQTNKQYKKLTHKDKTGHNKRGQDNLIRHQSVQLTFSPIHTKNIKTGARGNRPITLSLICTCGKHRSTEQ